MEYRQWGSEAGPLLLLLHAQGCHGGWWEWAGPLLPQRYRIVAPDLRGHGRTAWSAEGDYRFAAYAADVEALVDRLGGGPYALVGHSMGGYIGLQVAARGRLKPAALLVADMKTSASEEELAAMRAAAAKPGRAYPTLDEAIGRYRLAPPEHCVPDERLSIVAAASFRLDESGWVPRFDRRALAIEPLEPLALARELAMPARFIRGERSVVMEREPSLALAATARAGLSEMAGLYHHLPLEEPEGFAALTAKFLEEVGF